MRCFQTLLLGLSLLSSTEALGHQSQGQPNGQYAGGFNAGSESLILNGSVEVEVSGPNGMPIPAAVYVSLLKGDGRVLMTALAAGGKARFNNVPKSELTALVVASGYETAKKSFEIRDRPEMKVKVDLQPMADKEAAASDRGIAALNPRAQKDIGKALEALRANRAIEARQNLEAARRDAPNSAEVAYLFGVYASQMNDTALARTYWMRALELNPGHLSALLVMSQELLHERKAAQATAYLERALEIEPTSWRAHMLLAQAELFQGKHEEAVKEAERAMELGHERAESVQPLLAHALFENGDKDRAIRILQDHVASHPGETNAAKLLEKMKAPVVTSAASGITAGANGGVAEDETSDLASDSMALSTRMSWLPPDVDDKMPAVEPGAVCALEDVVEKAGKQLLMFVDDVDRFTATETLVHESINKYGIAAAAEKRKFDYLVSIQDLRAGNLGVTEYRNGGGAQGEFPEGIVTNGLPALVLILHPYYAPNYEMRCEGLARAGGRLAWQIHFRQRVGKPNAIQTYQFGMNGPSYSASLKGRAWISADDYQIIRMETDIVAPIPQIRLVAEHTAVEYGPVKFQQADVSLWLPQSAEVYLAWQGKQMHRRHSFNNYLLFGVDEKQNIAAPKETAASPDAGPTTTAKP
jgi:tetratricopeptide (TPR) repeat protein